MTKNSINFGVKIMEITKLVAYIGLIVLIFLLLVLRPILGITFCIVIIVVIFYNRNKNKKIKNKEE